MQIFKPSSVRMPIESTLYVTKCCHPLNVHSLHYYSKICLSRKALGHECALGCGGKAPLFPNVNLRNTSVASFTNRPINSYMNKTLAGFRRLPVCRGAVKISTHLQTRTPVLQTPLLTSLTELLARVTFCMQHTFHRTHKICC